MGEEFNKNYWIFIVAITLFVFLLLYRRTQSTEIHKVSVRLPPGTSGWPLIGDGLKWYNSVSSSHPPKYVEDQIKRYDNQKQTLC